MIKINSVAIPTPSAFQVGIQDISKAERNANGLMIIERIATKRKLELSWSYLSQSSLASLLQAVSGVFFTVEYPDPQTGALNTGTFYVGDRKADAIDYQGNTMRWKDVKFSLVER
ncbi:DUF6711 family protein [Desulfosporosinus fructosivorans]